MVEPHDAKLIPGFVDIQVNGTHGIDFSQDGLSSEMCLRAFRLIRTGGTAAFLPTVITAPEERLLRNLETIATASSEYENPEAVCGIHLEGPFLDPTPGAIGAHNPEWIRSPDISLFDRLQDAAQGRIRVLTVSAGRCGIEQLIRHVSSSGVVVSVGHHLAGYAEVRQAANSGARVLTHLGNGLPHLINRHDNPLLAGLVETRLDASIITDGHHLPDELVRLILRVKGVDHTVVVSDASPVCGLPSGRHTTFGSDVDVTADGLVINPVTGYLAGSGRTMLQCMNHIASLGELSYEELLAIGVHNPAGIVGIDIKDLSGPGVRFDTERSQFVTTELQ